MYKGYDTFFGDVGKYDKIWCRVCLTECDIQRDVVGATGFVEAMARHKHAHDRFICPHAEEDWHKETLKLVQEYENTRSKRLRNLIAQDINDMLDKHLPDGNLWVHYDFIHISVPSGKTKENE